MRIIAKSSLREFWENDSTARKRLKAWYNTVRKESWDEPLDVEKRYPNGSAIEDSRFVFRLGGYRLVTHIAYEYHTVYIKWVGSHDDYDDINATEVDDY